MITFLHTNNPSFCSRWGEAVTELKSVSPFYTSLVRGFEMQNLGKAFVRDDSFMVFDSDQRCVALVPLFLTCVDDHHEYSFRGGWHLQAPLFQGGVNMRKNRTVVQATFEHIRELATQSGAGRHRVTMDHSTIMRGEILYNYFSEFQYNEHHFLGLVLRLDRDETTLWSEVRASYKPLINRASRKYQVEIITSDSYSFERCEEYRKLHAIAAGRKTRPQETFHAMYKMIENNEAYLILVCDSGSVMGAYFFYCFRDHAYYASAATHPDYPSKAGIGHLGLWRGIQEAARRGCTYFDFGLLSGKSAKEQNIEFFKLGFGGEKVVVFAGERIF